MPPPKDPSAYERYCARISSSLIGNTRTKGKVLRSRSESHKTKIGLRSAGNKYCSGKRWVLTDEQKSAMSARMKGRKLSESTRHKMSESQKKRPPRRKGYKVELTSSQREVRSRKAATNLAHQNNFHHFKSVPTVYGNIRFRSRSEARLAEYFDRVEVKWNYEPCILKWVDQHGCMRSYLPDFYLPDLDIYVEVKGWLPDGTVEKLESVELVNNVVVKLVMTSDIKRLYKVGFLV